MVFWLMIIVIARKIVEVVTAADIIIIEPEVSLA
jgi:hypothetical protein